MEENVCCPELLIVPCADTDEHSHMVCGYSMTVLDNDTIIGICVKNHTSCVLRSSKEIAP